MNYDQLHQFIDRTREEVKELPIRRVLIIVVVIATLMSAAIADTSPNAERLYAEGQIAYNRADYATAIVKWQASYELSNESGLLFNLAQARRLSGDCTGAIATYRRFIAADPTADQSPLALDLVHELEPKCVPVKPISKLPDLIERLNSIDRLHDREDRAAHQGRILRIAGLATSGAGIVTLTTGLLLGRHASSSADEVTRACALSCDWAVQKSKDDAGRRDAKIGYALDIVGVAAIAGGAVMYYLGSKSPVTVAPTQHEGGAVVSFHSSW